MRLELPDGYELDDDRDRVDVDLVHRFLADEAYWVKGRSRETVGLLVREATRVVGVYRGDEQVGFARVVSDGVSFAWLGDVFELIREAVQDPRLRDLLWYLNTRDAHELYERFGFRAPNDRTMVRPSSGS
jgi:hypothetical protein